MRTTRPWVIKVRKAALTQDWDIPAACSSSAEDVLPEFNRTSSESVVDVEYAICRV
jgi:hypothetical protein